jgi:hypothetical protein
VRCWCPPINSPKVSELVSKAARFAKPLQETLGIQTSVDERIHTSALLVSGKRMQSIWKKDALSVHMATQVFLR